MNEIGSDLGRVVVFSLGASWDCVVEGVPWARIGTAVERKGHECLIGTIIATITETCSVGWFGAALGKRWDR